jgi:predicted RNA-binding Zn-ribbon protein involved in translation (DUF1610 family)
MSERSPIARMLCPGCGAVMNPHAEKPVEPPGGADAPHVDWMVGGAVEEVHQCPACGWVESRRA